MVSNKEKKAFIKWLMNTKQFKRRECVWIMNYLMDNDDLLSRTHFVTSAGRLDVLDEKQRLILMGCHCVPDVPPFKYFKDGNLTTDAERAFHDIRLNRHQPIFINIQYRDAISCDNYFMVEEDDEVMLLSMGININHPPRKEPEKSSGALAKLQAKYYEEISPEVEPTINSLCDNLSHEFKVKKLKEDIDSALDKGDKELFLKLSNELNELAQPKKLFETVK